MLGILNKIAGVLQRPMTMCPIVMIAILVLLAVPTGLVAGDLDDRRAWVALDVFPSLVAADQDILAKTGPDGNLVLLIVYMDNNALAEDMAAHLRKIGNIREAAIRVEIAAGRAFGEFIDTPLAGVFVAEKMGRELDDVVRFGTEKNIVVFSPFEEDVERGAHAGIMISDRVVPFVNMTAMRESNIRIKPFFLRISEIHE